MGPDFQYAGSPAFSVAAHRYVADCDDGSSLCNRGRELKCDVLQQQRRF
jgi:hypothetical protein